MEKKLKKIKGKRVTKTALWQRRMRAQGLCPECGNEPLMLDPRYMRDIQIRSDLKKGMTVQDVAAKYKMGPRRIRGIRNELAGQPRLLTRCQSCLRNNADSHLDRRERRALKQAQAMNIQAAGNGDNISTAT